MHVKISENRSRDRSSGIGFVRRNLRFIILLPALSLALAAMLWSMIFSKLDSDRKLLEEQARKQTTSISKTYAQYLTRTVEQLDQLSQQIKYGWESSNGKLNFEDMANGGLLDVPQFISIAIYGENGKPVTTSIPVTKTFTVTDRDYFHFHQENRSGKMRIGVRTIGRLSGKEIIQVTRRIDNNDGSFGGVLVMGIASEFFSLFSGDPVLEQGGILAFVGEDGIKRMWKTSGQRSRDAAPEKNTDASNTYLLPDENRYFIATQKLNGYPFLALVGLNREQVLLPYERNAALYHRIAVAGSIVLLMFAMAAAWMSSHLNWRKRQADSIRETYRLATEGGNEGFYIIFPHRDRNGFITDFEIGDCNEKGAAFFGMGRERFLGSKVSTFYTGEYFERLMRTYRSAMEIGFYEDDYRVPEESPVAAEWLHRKFVRAENGLAVTVRDISESKRHESELSRRASEDGLTTLPNRHWLMTYLPLALATAHSNSSMIGILFIDLDDFKNVNDTLGHSAGDQLLCAVASRLKSVVRSTDKVIRIGGDEFTVVLEAIHNEEEIAHIAFAINQTLREPFEITRDTTPQKNRIGASIGISMFPRDGTDVETLLKNADIAMYAAKSDSKGQFRFYDRMLYENIRTRLNTEQELMQAIKEDRFLLHYQPRVHAMSGRLLGMEALIRWQHPERGLIPPNDFIGLAEETGMINIIGEIVVDKVCAQMVSWRKQGVDIVPVSINVSAHQFNEGKVKKIIEAGLAKHGLPAALLEIELTESAMMRNGGDIFDEIAALNKMGIKVNIDDFGTGYSSLSLLQRLDMDVLKIDQAFTSQLGRGNDGEIFFGAIVTMAKALGMRVVAEGVETAEQLAILQTLNCDEVQGYYVAHPLSPDDMCNVMRQPHLFS